MAGEFISKEGYLKLYSKDPQWVESKQIMSKGDGACYISAVSFYVKLSAYTGQAWDVSRCTTNADIWYWDDDAARWEGPERVSTGEAKTDWWLGGYHIKIYGWGHNFMPTEGDEGDKTARYSKFHRWFVRFTTEKEVGTYSDWSTYGSVSVGTARQVTQNNGIYDPFEKGKLIYGLVPTCVKTSDTSPRQEEGGLKLPLHGTLITSENGRYVFAK